MARQGITHENAWRKAARHRCLAAIDGKLVAVLGIADTVKTESAETVEQLKKSWAAGWYGHWR